jgi:hypothetical protein
MIKYGRCHFGTVCKTTQILYLNHKRKTHTIDITKLQGKILSMPKCPNCKKEVYFGE